MERFAKPGVLCFADATQPFCKHALDLRLYQALQAVLPGKSGEGVGGELETSDSAHAKMWSETFTREVLDVRGFSGMSGRSRFGSVSQVKPPTVALARSAPRQP